MYYNNTYTKAVVYSQNTKKKEHLPVFGTYRPFLKTFLWFDLFFEIENNTVVILYICIVYLYKFYILYTFYTTKAIEWKKTLQFSLHAMLCILCIPALLKIVWSYRSYT